MSSVDDVFGDFFKYLKSDDWIITSDLTHQMLKKINGVSREKFHIKEGVKRWVYVLNKETFESEPEVQQEVSDFTNKEESAF